MMKWALAASQAWVLLVLFRRSLCRGLPALTAFSAFAVLSCAVYDPLNPITFAWLALPSFAVRGWVLSESLRLVIPSRYREIAGWVALAALIGGLMAVSLVYLFDRGYGFGVLLAAYGDVLIAGTFWTMLGTLWFTCGVRLGWRLRCAVALGVYLAVTAAARCSSGNWELSNNAAMGARALCFVWLWKELPCGHEHVDDDEHGHRC